MTASVLMNSSPMKLLTYVKKVKQVNSLIMEIILMAEKL